MSANPLIPMGEKAKAAARILATTPTSIKNDLLLHLADGLITHRQTIIAANARDIADGKAAGLSGNLLDRMLIDEARLQGIASDTRSVAALPDPVGSEYDSRLMPNGLRISRRRTPLGVLGLIYEARPNVTVDIAALALKTGNAAIMRGGKDIRRSNLAILEVIHQALDSVRLPRTAIQYIEDPDRALVGHLLKLHDYVDMIIPRGGESLHKLCRENSTIPVITGGIGICHVYVDESADLEQALPIIHNAKTQRPSVCNSLDTVLVHEAVAAELLPLVVEHLAASGVSFRAEDSSAGAGIRPSRRPPGRAGRLRHRMAQPHSGPARRARPGCRHRPYPPHSTNHSDAILTENWSNAQRFLDEVDSSAVFVNASTRFNDGGQFGLGAEVAVSTQKLHARGPMGLQELTTYKWIVLGEGHVRP